MRLKKIFAVISLMAAFALTIAAQQQSSPIEDAPAALARLGELNRLRQLQTDAERALFTGELVDSKADSFGKLNGGAPDKVLLIDKTHAVGRFQIAGADDRTIDVYFYLKNEDAAGWKIYAARAFSLPKFIFQLYESLKERTDLKADEKQSFDNLKLMLASDKDLHAWFTENRPSLEKLRSLLPAAAEIKTAQLPLRFDEKQFPAAAALLKKLNLSGIGIEKNGDVKILIGGILDNSVGFIYSPTGKPPEITTYDYIWVENLGDNWYFYRTT